MDIDGDALLGLIEKGGRELATQLISNVEHWLKIIRKINQLLRERLKHVSRYESRADRGKLELAKLYACFNGVFMQWNSVNMHEIKESLLPSRKQCDSNEM